MAVVKRNAAPQRWSLIAILFVAFALRVFDLGAQSLWYDEGVTAFVSRLPLPQLTRWTADDIQPPLYYSLVALWGQAAGWSEFALRLPSVLWGVTTVALIYALTKVWARRPAPEMAAAIAAVHPLLVYYSQEARMYAMLTALGVVCGWLISLALTRAQSARLWIAYALAATAAIYTHYFAFFLLIALGLAYLALYRPLHPGARHLPLLGFTLSQLVILLLYTPWFSVLFMRLSVDASYWQGELKVEEALRHAGVSFVTGETLFERQAVLLGSVIGLLTVVAIVLAWRRAPQMRPAVAFGLLWFVIPLVGVVMLASVAPKFHARYVMISLPGLILAWSISLTTLLVLPHATASSGVATSRSRGARFTAVGLIVSLALSFTAANLNWFFNDAFAKAQWRQLVEFLRPRIAPDETVILVSGHAWPVWDYYAPDLPPVRLPNLDVLNVDQVLTFENTAHALQAAAEEYPGAWLVLWQEEVVDPNDIVPVQLELSGREKGSSALFNQLTLRRFSRLRPARIAEKPPIQRTVGQLFGDSLLLEGVRALDNGDLLLFWRKQNDQAQADDYRMKMEVFDASGQLIARPPDRRLAGYNYPTFRWRNGEVVMGRIPAVAWLGSEPQAGRYTVRLAVYDANDPALTPLPIGDSGDVLIISDVEAVIE